MKQRLLSAITASLFLMSLVSAPAHAAGGGSTLPFNDTLTLIQDNLTGPTANTIVVILIVCGLIAIGVSKETPWLKTLGGLAVICALIAKAATLPSALGLGSATGTAGAYSSPAALLSLAWLAAAIAPLLALLKGERRSPKTRF
jgi:type IV secretory pathway VirB2 component (pilin)